MLSKCRMNGQFEMNFNDPEGSDDGYRKWQESVACAPAPRREIGDQAELVMDGQGSEDGYLKWQQSQEERRLELGRQFGLIFDSPVRLSLTFLEHEVVGCIRMANDSIGKSAGSEALRINDLNFFPEEVESVVKLVS